MLEAADVAGRALLTNDVVTRHLRLGRTLRQLALGVNVICAVIMIVLTIARGWAIVGFALTQLNAGFDEITNPRLQLEHAWRTFLGERGRDTERSTPVVRDHD